MSHGVLTSKLVAGVSNVVDQRQREDFKGRGTSGVNVPYNYITVTCDDDAFLFVILWMSHQLQA